MVAYRIDPEAVKPIQSLKHTISITISEVRKLLGLLGYYIPYIRDFSHIAKHLFDLLQTKELKNDVTTKAKKTSSQPPPSHSVGKHSEILQFLLEN